jgi:hypothetical protein
MIELVSTSSLIMSAKNLTSITKPFLDQSHQ